MGSTYNRVLQKSRRQYLRNHATRAERTLWWNLKGGQLLGYKFRRQYGVGSYVLDFYCPELRLAIEVDGATHESSEAVRLDRKRQTEIERHGIRFLRFTDDQVLGNVQNVVLVIEAEVQKAST
jgi:very-short-patch-repair endonuclease